jgi:hypothetical protein
MTERCSSLVHFASGPTIFTLLLRRRVAFLYRTAILQAMNITVVNLQDNRAVFRIFIALLRFSFVSPSYMCHTLPNFFEFSGLHDGHLAVCVCLCVCM